MANETLGASFSIDTTNLKAGLSQANRLIRESESEFKAAAAGMDDWTKKEAGLTAKIKSLNQVTDLQQKKVNALQSEYDRLIANGLDPTSKEAVELRTKINNETAAMEKNKKQAEELEDALKGFRAEAEKTGKTVDEVAAATKEAGDNAEDAGDGFTTMKGAVATFAGNALTSLVDGLKNAATSLFALSEETREYRNELAKLNTSFEMAGLTGEQAKSTFTELYGILGDEGAATEAAQQLAKISKGEEDLEANTRILTGVMAEYGNSIPLEGLAEGIAASSAMSSVQGVLADALEWQGINLDEYNEKLASLSTKEERAAHIQKTLTKLYGASADAYLKNNEAVIKANKSQLEYNDTMAEMGEEMEPVNAEIQSMKNEFMKELLPVLKKHVLPAISNFIKKCKESGLIKKLAEIIGWAAENFESLAGGIMLAVGAWKALTIITSVVTAIKSATTAMGALNAVMAANPIGAVVTTVALLATGIGMLIDTTEEAAEVTDVLNERQRETAQAAEEAAEAFQETSEAADEMAASGQAQMAYCVQLWEELENLADANGKVQESDKARAEFILGELSNALGKEYTMTGNTINNYKQMKASIEDVIETKRAQILLEAYEEKYAEAVKNVAEEEKNRANWASKMAEKEISFTKAKADMEDYYAERLDAGWTHSQILSDQTYLKKVDNWQKEAQEYKKLMDEYDNSDAQVKKYYDAIDSYTTASTLVLQGETDKAIGYLDKYGSGFKTAKSVAKETKDEQLKILKEQVINTSIQLGILETEFDENQDHMTEEEIRQAKLRIANAKKQAEDAKDEYAEVGGNMVEGMAKGAEDGEWTLTGALKRTVDAGIAAVKRTLGIKSPSRVYRKLFKFVPEGAALGVTDGTPSILKAVKKQINVMRNAYDVNGLSSKLNAVRGDFVALNTNTRQNANNGVAGVANGKNGLVVNQYNNFKQAQTSQIEKYKAKQELFAAARLIKAGAI